MQSVVVYFVFTHLKVHCNCTYEKWSDDYDYSNVQVPNVGNPQDLMDKVKEWMDQNKKDK